MLSYTTQKFFIEQRAAWMLKAPTPAKERIDMQSMMDRNKNPHNDSYKPKLRSEAEIVGDLAREFADGALAQIYGRDYQEWLKDYVNGQYFSVNHVFHQQETQNA